jgi:hypothetical protein
MTLLVDDLIRRPALLDREVSKEIERRLASIDDRSRDIERKLDAIDKMVDDKEARMIEQGYRIDLVRSRREASAP